MNEEREHRIEKVKSLIDNGEIYQAMRESLALRPPPPELIDLIGRRHPAAFDSRAVTGSMTSLASLQEMAQRLLRPSDRASNPYHPVGSMAAAIRRALPDFQEWSIDAGKAAAHLLTFTGERRDRLMAVLPPGFAEGRPGSFLRATRAILHLRENGPVQSFYELLQASPDQETFRAAMNDTRISDVLDLTWMVAGPLELRSVQDLLERVSAAVLPGQPVRFSPYDEPRYRSALQLHSGDVWARLACGGVLAEWPGRPQDVDAGHLRIFLEPWATVHTGHAVEFDRIATRLGSP